MRGCSYRNWQAPPRRCLCETDSLHSRSYHLHVARYCRPCGVAQKGVPGPTFGSIRRRDSEACGIRSGSDQRRVWTDVPFPVWVIASSRWEWNRLMARLHGHWFSTMASGEFAAKRHSVIYLQATEGDFYPQHLLDPDSYRSRRAIFRHSEPSGRNSSLTRGVFQASSVRLVVHSAYSWSILQMQRPQAAFDSIAPVIRAHLHFEATSSRRPCLHYWLQKNRGRSSLEKLEYSKAFQTTIRMLVAFSVQISPIYSRLTPGNQAHVWIEWCHQPSAIIAHWPISPLCYQSMRPFPRISYQVVFVLIFRLWVPYSIFVRFMQAGANWIVRSKASWALLPCFVALPVNFSPWKLFH